MLNQISCLLRNKKERNFRQNFVVKTRVKSGGIYLIIGFLGYMLTLDSRDTCGTLSKMKERNEILRILIQNIKKYKILIIQMIKEGKGKRKSFVYFTQIYTSGNACVPVHRYHGNLLRHLFVDNFF